MVIQFFLRCWSISIQYIDTAGKTAKTIIVNLLVECCHCRPFFNFSPIGVFLNRRTAREQARLGTFLCFIPQRVGIRTVWRESWAESMGCCNFKFSPKPHFSRIFLEPRPVIIGWRRCIVDMRCRYLSLKRTRIDNDAPCFVGLLAS